MFPDSWQNRAIMRSILPLLLVFLVLPATADDRPKANAKAKRKPPARSAPTEPAIRTAQITLGGRTVKYRATAAFLPLLTEKGETTAHVFHVAYVETGTDAKKRPVTFVFNGGPGAASVWLHLGGLGPRRVKMSEEGWALKPPGRVIDNAESWLSFTDLVFIDPVGTGYSRPAKGHKQKEFSGIREDAQSVGEFIRRWTVENGRWESPKFLCGESYGTTRAAALSGELQGKYGLYLNGIVLVSSVLNFQTIRFGRGNDLPYVLFLPAYTATAWYHGALAAELQGRPLTDVLREAEAFALNTYLPALAKGDALPKDENIAVRKLLSKWTGLSEEFVARSNLRLPLPRFAKELLRKQRRTVGRLDSRYKGIDRDNAGGRYEYDAAMSAISGPFSQAIKHYLRRELGFKSTWTYETLSGRVRPWSYKGYEGRYVNVAGTLRDAMTKNPHLRVLIASGYFDLATPYFATDYTVRHLGLDPALRGHLKVAYYEAGHMMYVRQKSRRKLQQDAAAFYRDALK